ncbi:MAG: response regulator [Proteobacteria bacterium]|nr:response regulator [Pseudomonadota bacterium]
MAAPKTILVVEDDPTMRQLLLLHLTNAGYAVRAAANGIEAGHAILGTPPDLVITDVNMPHMTGFELVAALREDPSLKDLPVIFLTIEGDAFERGAYLGAVEYLTKPIRVEALLQKVARHLPPGAP